MRGVQTTQRRMRRLTAASLLLLLSLPVPAQTGEPPGVPVTGRILSPEAARVVVRRESYLCSPMSAAPADILLLTVGTESQGDTAPHFHPLATLAFDRSLGEGDAGQWVALWTFGPSPAGWRRTLRAFLPLPVGRPRASADELARLEERLEEIRQAPDAAELSTSSPAVHLGTLGRASRSQGVWGALKRGLSWAGAVNPAQFVFRTYLTRRKDRRERQFQRGYLALQWLLDVEYTGHEEAGWLESVNELRFHLLRNRSFFGRWVEHADALELVSNYESAVRVQLGKTSSWLQSAANEHHLRYQPIYRYTQNGAAFPFGGVLYYDPRLGVTPDPGWWSVANPFDLPYNPHRHPKVQRLAREHPDELIPLAVYTFQTHLALRPIIAVDFFAPGNPRRRESTQQLMVLLKHWLTITTGALSLERLPYRAVAWAANKKGFTLLVDKSSRLGIEELRLALESDLYFDPELRGLLLERADRRVLNPLIKAGPVEERLAHLQYESLLARDHQPVCRLVEQVRRTMMARLGVPPDLSPADQPRELARRLRTWRQQVLLEDFVSQPLTDFGSLGSLDQPLRYFLDNHPGDGQELDRLLARLYAKLYAQKLRLPEPEPLPELEATLALTRRVWERTAPATSSSSFSERLAKLEETARRRDQKEQRQEEKRRRQALRELLSDTHDQLQRARKAGCQAATDAPAELDAHLTLLWEVARAAADDEALRAEFQRHLSRLRRDLEGLEAALSRCPTPPTPDSWRADWERSCLELTRALLAELGRSPAARAAGGG